MIQSTEERLHATNKRRENMEHAVFKQCEFVPPLPLPSCWMGVGGVTNHWVSGHILLWKMLNWVTLKKNHAI